MYWHENSFDFVKIVTLMNLSALLSSDILSCSGQKSASPISQMTVGTKRNFLTFTKIRSCNLVLDSPLAILLLMTGKGH